MNGLTRRQQEVYELLCDLARQGHAAPSLEEICDAMGLKSRGSLHKHIKALQDLGLVEPMNKQQRGVRLCRRGDAPFLGYIAAGRAIEAVNVPQDMDLAAYLSQENSYWLEVKGDSMVDMGIFDGDRILIHRQSWANNGQVVVALIDGQEVSLKAIEQKPNVVVLHPFNREYESVSYESDRVTIQGVLNGLIRRYS